MRFEDMIELANRNYKICLLMEREFPAEYAVGGAMYHMQQAVEKSLNAIILFSGDTPTYTHNIAKLVCECDKCGISLPSSLIDIADTLSQWESTTRYDVFVDTSGDKYEKAKKAYNELSLQINRLLPDARHAPDTFALCGKDMSDKLDEYDDHDDR